MSWVSTNRPAGPDAGAATALRIVVVTTFFPNSVTPLRTMFVRNLVMAMRAHCEVLAVVAPLPYAPPVPASPHWKKLRLVPSAESRDGLTVEHPRFVAIPGLQFLNGITYGARILPTLWRLKRERGTFLVHGHCAYPDGVGVAIAARLLSLPYVITAHGSDINVYSHRRALMPQIRWALRRASGIIAVSEALLQRIRVLLGAAAHAPRAESIPCAGFDPLIFGPAKSNTPSPQGGRVVVFVGHLVPIKGVPYLLKAWHQLAEAKRIRPDDSLVIVGDGPERAMLESLARDIGCRDSVRFTGSLPHDQVAAQIELAHLLCLPSLNEGTPNVVVEALASGVPVVASRVGGIPDLIQEGLNGYLAEAGNVADLVRALTHALERDWSRQAIYRCAQHLTWDTLALRNVAFLRGTLGTSV